ncbi:MAG: ABC transporter substrate-binding protein [Azoarcus sp.]|nr:ABC transporter substrate-binding protein [Azoarcus sp.]
MPPENPVPPHNRARRAFLKSSLMASAGVLVAASAARAADGNPVPVRITLPSPGSAGSVWRPLVARLDPALSSGLDLQWVTADPGKMQIQLAAGALDVGVFGAVGLGNLVLRGQDIVLFGPALNNHGKWLVQNDSPYRKPADLIGKRIATQPETSETYQQARLAASLAGIDLKRDVEVIFGPPTANLALFERGDVDAVIVLEPTATRLVANGVREIARVADMWKQASGGEEAGSGDPFLVGLAARREWVENNRVTATRLARLFAAANGALRADTSVLDVIYTEIGFREHERHALPFLKERLPAAYSTRWDESVWKVIDRQIDDAVRLGLIASRPPRPLYDGVRLDGART